MLVLLLFFGLSATVLVSAGSVNATGGFISYMNLTVQQQTAHWTGFFGQFIFAQPSFAPSGITAGGGNLSLQSFNVSTTCPNPTNITGVLMFTNASALPSGLTPGNLTLLDSLVPGFSDSPSNTFTQNSSFVIGGNTINNVPTAYTYINSTAQNVSFREGYMQDSSGNLVFASVIEENIPGFNLTTYDFQAIVPVINYGPSNYNVFIDFTYTCPLNDTYERLVYPDGLFELAGVYNKSVTLPTFSVVFEGLSLSANNTIECIVYTSNSSQTRRLNYTTPVQITNQTFALNYT
ncbi:hypothetical protein GF371_05585, partial [Candidatus Woesearchaeota archaeon]|nr:hypothetical protein [Candidatus Woesearchaeota archaeon]